MPEAKCEPFVETFSFTLHVSSAIFLFFKFISKTKGMRFGSNEKCLYTFRKQLCEKLAVNFIKGWVQYWVTVANDNRSATQRNYILYLPGLQSPFWVTPLKKKTRPSLKDKSFIVSLTSIRLGELRPLVFPRYCRLYHCSPILEWKNAKDKPTPCILNCVKFLIKGHLYRKIFDKLYPTGRKWR